MMKKPAYLFLLFTLLVGVAAGETPAQESPDYWPTDGWRASTPEAQGMDSELLLALVEQLREDNPGVDSVLIVRNGYLVLEVYFEPYGPDDKHVIHSCTKSIVSALIGIAIDQGYIAGVDQPVLDLFPDQTFEHLDEDKAAMTLEHLLMMGSGLRCRDSYLYRWRGLSEMMATDDWPRHVLSLPMEHEPGTHFEYCNGGSFTLSAIISETTGRSALEFAREVLFGPLGITDVTWPANPRGISIGWGELRMRPRDMAKFGYLYLSDGIWEGEQIVPAEWVAASTRAQIDAGTLSDRYGYQWWVDDNGYQMALGYSGQYIVVAPEANMVVVFTSNLPDEQFFFPEQLLNQYIIPAAVATEPLAENPGAAAALTAAIADFAPDPENQWQCRDNE